MNKKVIVLLLIALLTVSGCSNSSSSNAITATKAPTATITPVPTEELIQKTTDIPTPINTPTNIPSNTPTNTPELTPTSIVEVTNTSTPTPTEELKKYYEDDSIIVGNYIGLELRSTTDFEVELQIARVLEGYKELRDVSRPAENGDIVNIDFVGKKDGVPFEGGTAEGYNLELGSNSFIDGFESGLLGTKAGETIDLTLTFPEYYQSEELAGQTVVFTVTVNAVKEMVVPELTDQFVNQNFEVSSVEAYKEQIKASLNHLSYQEQIEKQLMEVSTLKIIPEEEVKETSDSLYNMYIQYAGLYSQYFGMSEEEILASVWGFSSKENLREYTDQYANESVSYLKVIEKIAEIEKIAPTDSQFEERGTAYAKQYQYEDLDSLIQAEGINTVLEAITMDMVLEFIISKAIIK